MMEYRLYLDGKLVNCCISEFAYMCNCTNYKNKYGDRVSATYTEMEMDDEKREWLNSLSNKNKKE